MKILLHLIFLFAVIDGALAQQSSADMAAQMNAAGALRSAASNPTFATPLVTYQQYYSGFTGGHSQAMFACYTAAFTQTETDGGGMPTTAQFSVIDSHLAGIGFGNFQLLSFVFTADTANPKITFIYVTVKNNIPIKEQIALTLVDGVTGWLINSIENQELPGSH